MRDQGDLFLILLAEPFRHYSSAVEKEIANSFLEDTRTRSMRVVPSCETLLVRCCKYISILLKSFRLNCNLLFRHSNMFAFTI